jgi:hypothetical protein
MATTTPNFGWPVPTSTDLVKDGATAIEALGDGIDTSMVDLKGGTTGQILAKATNADMDFAWITNDVGDITAITASSPITGGGTSGDVTVGILDATTSNKGAVQLSTSTTSTSTSLAATASAVKAAYDPAFTNNFYAGKNKAINGDFGIWQRGTTFNNLVGHFADRFQIVPSGTVTSMTTSQQTFTLGSAPVAGYEGTFFARNTITTVGTLTNCDIQNRIENVTTFAGQTVTLSFWAKADSARSSIVYLVQNFGSGGSSEAFTSTPTLSVTTSWVRYSFTLSVPSISGKTIGANNFLGIGIRQVVAAGSVLDIWGVQLEAGSTATPFQTATGTIQGELAACQRYYYRQGGDAPFQGMGLGVATSTTNGSVQVALPVQMRVAPTSIDFSTLGLYSSGSVIAVTTATIDTASKNIVRINAAVSSGLTQDRAYQLLANNSTSALIGFSAEF